MKRCLPGDQNQPPLILERHLRGADEEVVREGIRDPGKGLHRARDHHHRRGLERTGGDCSCDVPDPVAVIGQRLNLFDGQIRLQGDGSLGRVRHDEVSLDVVRLPQDLQQANAVDDTAGATDSDDDLFHPRVFLLARHETGS